MGGQLKGQSSVDGYVNAIKRGCKCVESKFKISVGTQRCLVRFRNIFRSPNQVGTQRCFNV